MKRTQVKIAKVARGKRTRGEEKGSALIEFALCMAFFWTPLFLGTYQIGFNLIRAVQVTQICRDAGHMYSQGADFSSSAYQTLLNGLMPSSFQATSTGNTVLYMSTVTYVDGNACVTGGVVSNASLANSTNCPNFTKMVFTRQIPYGNTSLHDADFGTPCKYAGPGSQNSIMDSGYNIAPQFYVKDSRALATNFAIPMSNGQEIAFMSEMFVQSSDISVWKSVLGTSVEYARSIF